MQIAPVERARRKVIDYYLWFKVLHAFGFIAWMSGIFYLPRLYVYHADAAIGSIQSETFKVMERRLLYGIMNPSMIATLVFGGLMLVTAGYIDWSAGWIWIKLSMIVLILLVHVLCFRWCLDFAIDRNTRSAKFYKIWNEAPVVPLLVILIMAIVKPF